MNENLPGQDKAQVPVLSTPLLPQQRRIRKCCGTVSKSSCQDTCCYSQQKNQTVFNEDEKYSHLCKSRNYTVCLCTFTFSGKKKAPLLHTPLSLQCMLQTPVPPRTAVGASHVCQLAAERNTSADKCCTLPVKERFHAGWRPS